VTVFAAGANGNVTPIQDIVGSYTDLTAPTGLALDAEDNIYVANSIGNSITFMLRRDRNVAPIRAIAGSLTIWRLLRASPSMPQATSTSRTQTFTSLARPA